MNQPASPDEGRFHFVTGGRVDVCRAGSTPPAVFRDTGTPPPVFRAGSAPPAAKPAQPPVKKETPLERAQLSWRLGIRLQPEETALIDAEIDRKMTAGYPLLSAQEEGRVIDMMAAWPLQPEANPRPEGQFMLDAEINRKMAAGLALSAQESDRIVDMMAGMYPQQGEQAITDPEFEKSVIDMMAALP